MYNLVCRKKCWWVLSLLLACLVTSCKKTTNAPNIAEEVRHIAELKLAQTTIEQVFTIKGYNINLGGIRNLNDLSEVTTRFLRVGDRIGVYTTQITAVATMDVSQFSDANITLFPNTKQVALTLPPITVTIAGRNPELKILHERVTGTQPPITQQERRQALQDITPEAQRRLAEGTTVHQQLIKHAQAQAHTFFQELVQRKGYTLKEITYL